MDLSFLNLTKTGHTFILYATKKGGFIMDRNLQIFINFLDKSIEDIQEGIFKRAVKRMVKELLPEDEKDIMRITERKNMRRLLSVPREEWDLHGEIYIQFDY